MINIDNFLNNYVPKVVTEQYPLLRTLYKYYYEWLCQENNPYYNSSKLFDNTYTDTMMEEFLQYQFNDLMYKFPEIKQDKRFTLKTIKDMYSSKGIIKSFEYLNKLFFGTDCEVYLPSNYLLKSSDSIYNKIYTVNTEDIVDILLIGKVIIFENRKFLISNIIKKTKVNDFYEIMLLETTLTANAELNVTPINCLKSITINNGGVNYQVGDVVKLTNNSTFNAVVSKVNKGEILSLTINNGGINYQVGDVIFFKNTNPLGSSSKFIVKAVDENGSITELSHSVIGKKYDNIPIYTIITDNGTDLDITINHNINSIVNIDILNTGIYVEETDTLEVESNGENAILSFETNGLGYKITNNTKSSTSSEFVIQDSYKWQDFSYVLKTTQDLSDSNSNQLSNYRSYFLNIIHPAGQEMFSELSLYDNISFDIDTELNITYEAILLVFLEWFNAGTYDTRLVTKNLFWLKDLTLNDLDNISLNDLNTISLNSSLYYVDNITYSDRLIEDDSIRLIENNDNRILEG